MSMQAASKARQKVIYMRLYRQADEILKTYNPCQFDTEGKCVGYSTGCCGGCPHLGPKGCTVEALSCKLWLCSFVQDGPAKKELNRLHQEVYAAGIYSLGCRKSFQEVFHERA